MDLLNPRTEVHRGTLTPWLHLFALGLFFAPLAAQQAPGRPSTPRTSANPIRSPRARRSRGRCKPQHRNDHPRSHRLDERAVRDARAIPAPSAPGDEHPARHVHVDGAEPRHSRQRDATSPPRTSTPVTSSRKTSPRTSPSQRQHRRPHHRRLRQPAAAVSTSATRSASRSAPNPVAATSRTPAPMPPRSPPASAPPPVGALLLVTSRTRRR